MKKKKNILKLLFSVFIPFIVIMLVYAESTRYPNGITAGTKSQEIDAGVTVGDGDIYAEDDIIAKGEILSGSGELGYNEIIDLPALSATVILNAVSIASATLVASGTTYVDGTSGTGAVGGMGFTQITYPRNISAVASFTYGTGTTTVAGTLTVYGYNAKGEYTSEVLSISTATATGNVAWVFIDTMTASGFTMSGAQGACLISAGVSNKIGIWGDLKANTDIYKITNAYVDYSSSTWARPADFTNATYDTINLGTGDLGAVPGGATDYRIWYRKNVKH